MTQCSGSDLSRQQHIQSILAKKMEKNFLFPRGVLSQGQITHFPSDANNAVWTDAGGVVVCLDEDLAASIVLAVIVEHGEEDYVALLSKLQETLSKSFPVVSCRFDVLFYCYSSPISLNSDLRKSVEMISFGDLKPEDVPPLDTVEHIFAIRDGSVVAAHTSSTRKFKDSGYWFHTLGARTHPDYRRRGFGKAVVSALVEHITSEGDVALWNCEVRNIASFKLARSVGFVEFMRKFSWE